MIVFPFMLSVCFSFFFFFLLSLVFSFKSLTLFLVWRRGLWGEGQNVIYMSAYYWETINPLQVTWNFQTLFRLFHYVVVFPHRTRLGRTFKWRYMLVWQRTAGTSANVSSCQLTNKGTGFKGHQVKYFWSIKWNILTCHMWVYLPVLPVPKVCEVIL